MVLFSKCGSGMVSYPYTLNEIRSTNGFEMSPVAVDNACARKSQRLLTFLPRDMGTRKENPQPGFFWRRRKQTKTNQEKKNIPNCINTDIATAQPYHRTCQQRAQFHSAPHLQPPLMPNTKNQEPRHKKTEKYLGKSHTYPSKNNNQVLPKPHLDQEKTRIHAQGRKNSSKDRTNDHRRCELVRPGLVLPIWV